MQWRSQLGDSSGERFGAPTSCWAWGVARKGGGLWDSRRSRCLGAVAGMEALGLRGDVVSGLLGRTVVAASQAVAAEG